MVHDEIAESNTVTMTIWWWWWWGFHCCISGELTVSGVVCCALWWCVDDNNDDNDGSISGKAPLACTLPMMATNWLLHQQQGSRWNGAGGDVGGAASQRRWVISAYAWSWYHVIGLSLWRCWCWWMDGAWMLKSGDPHNLAPFLEWETRNGLGWRGKRQKRELRR